MNHNLQGWFGTFHQSTFINTDFVKTFTIFCSHYLTQRASLCLVQRFSILQRSLRNEHKDRGKFQKFNDITTHTLA